MELIGLRTRIIRPGDDIVRVIADALERQGLALQSKDVLILAESAVATAEGRVIPLDSVTPDAQAVQLAEKYCIDPRKMQLILQECDEVLGGIPGVAVTITRGVLSANAGIDCSNAPPGFVVLLPSDPKKSAQEIRTRLSDMYGADVGVIIGDSRTQPLRLGCMGIALGCAGIEPVEDARGTKDLFGRPLEVTRKAIADNLVSAAEVIMGEAAEQTPAVLVRGAPVNFKDEDADIPLIAREECMYFGIFNAKSAWYR